MIGLRYFCSKEENMKQIIIARLRCLYHFGNFMLVDKLHKLRIVNERLANKVFQKHGTIILGELVPHMYPNAKNDYDARQQFLKEFLR